MKIAYFICNQMINHYNVLFHKNKKVEGLIVA